MSTAKTISEALGSNEQVSMEIEDASMISMENDYISVCR